MDADAWLGTLLVALVIIGAVIPLKRRATIRNPGPSAPTWTGRMTTSSIVFVVMLMPSAWGGEKAIAAVGGISCLIALTVNYLATSSEPKFRWLGGLILAWPLAALIVVNGLFNPNELHLIPFWLAIALAIYLSASIGGIFAGRK